MNMAFTLRLFFALILLTRTIVFCEDTFEEGTCEQLQYIEFDKTERLRCNFWKFFSVIWYNSTDYVDDEPIIYNTRSEKGGPGYISGEFDVGEGGSLIIRKVSLSHEHNFTVIKLNSSRDNLKPHNVRAVVSVRPLQSHPIIDKCNMESNICFINLTQSSNISCSVHGARPAAQLQWFRRTSQGDVMALQEETVEKRRISYTTSVTTLDALNDDRILDLFICKSVSFLPRLKNNESIVLIQNVESYLSSVESLKALVPANTKMKLPCSENNVTFFVWKRRNKNTYNFESIYYGILGSDIFQSDFSEGYNVDITGSLVVQNVSIRHEGTYHCVSGNGYHGDVRCHEVTIYVPPVPEYPVVEECQGSEEYCTLSVEREGVLTCVLNDMRPLVNLEWHVVSESSTGIIEFKEERHTVNVTEETFTIFLTSKFVIHSASLDRLTIECRNSETIWGMLQLSTELDLILINKQHSSTFKRPWVFSLLALVIIPLLAYCVMVTLKKAHKKEEVQKSIGNAEEVKISKQNEQMQSPSEQETLIDNNETQRSSPCKTGEEQELLAGTAGKHDISTDHEHLRKGHQDTRPNINEAQVSSRLPPAANIKRKDVYLEETNEKEVISKRDEQPHTAQESSFHNDSQVPWHSRNSMKSCQEHPDDREIEFCLTCDRKICHKCEYRMHTEELRCDVVDLDKLDQEMKDRQGVLGEELQALKTLIDETDKLFVEQLDHSSYLENMLDNVEKDERTAQEKSTRFAQCLLKKLDKEEVRNMEQLKSEAREIEDIQNFIKYHGYNGEYSEQPDLSELAKINKIKRKVEVMQQKIQHKQNTLIKSVQSIWFKETFKYGFLGELRVSSLIGGVSISANQVLHVFDERKAKGVVSLFCFDPNVAAKEHWQYDVNVDDHVPPVVMSCVSMCSDGVEHLVFAVGMTVYDARPRLGKSSSYQSIESVTPLPIKDMGKGSWINSIYAFYHTKDYYDKILISCHDSTLLREYRISGECVRKIETRGWLSSIRCIAYTDALVIAISSYHRDDVILVKAEEKIKQSVFMEPPSSPDGLLSVCILWTGSYWVVLYVSDGTEKVWKVVSYSETGQFVKVCQEGKSLKRITDPVSITRWQNFGYLSFADSSFKKFHISKK